MTASSKSQYSFETPRRQSLSLPYDVLTHLLHNCDSPELLLKLHKTCKYFLWKKNVIVVCVPAYSHSTGELAYYSTINPQFRMLNEPFQYWYTDYLRLSDHPWGQITRFLSNIYRCHFRALKIEDVLLNFKEISLLINGERIEELILDNVNIYYEDETPVNIYSLLEKCLQLRKLQYCNKCEKFSSKTFMNLNQIHFNNKLEKLWLYIPKIDGKLDPNIVGEYFKNVLSSDADIRLFFWRHFPKRKFNNFKSTVEKTIGQSFAKLLIDFYH